MDYEIEKENIVFGLKTPTNHYWLILHGRYVCMARSPKCEKCGITEYCKYYAKLKK